MQFKYILCRTCGCIKEWHYNEELYLNRHIPSYMGIRPCQYVNAGWNTHHANGFTGICYEYLSQDNLIYLEQLYEKGKSK